MNKYGNKKIEQDGMVFDSKKELKRWQELKLLQRAGEIMELKRQVPFRLLPSQRTPTGATVREVVYIADFTYRDKRGAFVIEDVKGFRTKDYILKKKLMLFIHGNWIKEV